MNRLSRIAAFGIALAVIPSMASAQTWALWNTFGSGAVYGTLFGSAVTYSGTYDGGQTSGGGGTDYWNGNSGTAAYTQSGLTVPSNVGFVQFIAPRSGTLTFATPVTDLYLALISVGQPGSAVTYTFNHAFTVVSDNYSPRCAFWGCGSYTTSGNSITGREFSGTLLFSGSLSTLSIGTDPGENWHGFTVGAEMATVPEPSSVALLATGVLGLAGMLRRRRKNVA